MRTLALTFAVLALTACGGHLKAASPEQVVREWSAALNRDDNEGAASLFAPGAEVVQTHSDELRTRDDAIRWNASLPCGGTITSVELQGKTQVLAVFTLKERPNHQCDGPGGQAAALFQVAHGKIVLWHQTSVPQPDGQTV